MPPSTLLTHLESLKLEKNSPGTGEGREPAFSACFRQELQIGAQLGQSSTKAGRGLGPPRGADAQGSGKTPGTSPHTGLAPATISAGHCGEGVGGMSLDLAKSCLT